MHGGCQPSRQALSGQGELVQIHIALLSSQKPASAVADMCLLCYQIVSVESPEAALGHLQSSAWGLEGHADAAAELSGKGLHPMKRQLCCLHAPAAHGGLCVSFELTFGDAKVLAGCNSGVQNRGAQGGSNLPDSGLKALFMPNQQPHSPDVRLADHSRRNP